jgi:hypothetical protein
MKTYQNPEFHIFYKLQLLREKYPDLPELAALEDEVREIINTNSLDILRWATVQAIPGRPGDLTPKTVQKMKFVLSTAQRLLEMDEDGSPDDGLTGEDS